MKAFVFICIGIASLVANSASAQRFDWERRSGGEYYTCSGNVSACPCDSPNPETGSCSCPRGFEEDSQLYQTHPNKGNMYRVTCEPSRHGGGGHSDENAYYTCSANISACPCDSPNPYTNACSCPRGSRPSRPELYQTHPEKGNMYRIECRGWGRN
jgi:hypothetical protein